MIRSSTSGSRLGTAGRRIADAALPLAFLALIAVVVLLTRWHVPPGTIDKMEMRPAVTMPALRLSGTSDPLHQLHLYSKKFFAFFDDNFGLRLWAIGERARLLLRLLALDPSPDPVFSSAVYPGRDGWLFFADNRLPADILHRDKLSAAVLNQWAKGIAERREWLARRGIRYLFVLAPDKRTIYSEKLPAIYRRHRPGLTRRQQLDRRLAGEPGYLDLTRTILAAKAKAAGPLYYRWGTHWTRLGAYYGYVATITKLGFKPLPRDLGRPEVPADLDGDLARMAGLHLVDRDRAPVAICPRPAPASAVAAVKGLEGADPIYAESSTICAGAPGRLLMFHDSFGSWWQPYLSTQFGLAAYAWTEPNFAQFKKTVEAVHPTVVIEQRVERFLIYPLR